MLVWHKKKSFFFLSLSDSAVSAHAPSSALQEIRKEQRLTAQFHKTQPRRHFIFSQPFFRNYIFHYWLLRNKQSDNGPFFQVIYPSCRALLLRFNPADYPLCRSGPPWPRGALVYRQLFYDEDQDRRRLIRPELLWWLLTKTARSPSAAVQPWQLYITNVRGRLLLISLISIRELCWGLGGWGGKHCSQSMGAFHSPWTSAFLIFSADWSGLGLLVFFTSVISAPMIGHRDKLSSSVPHYLMLCSHQACDVHSRTC